MRTPNTPIYTHTHPHPDTDTHCLILHLTGSMENHAAILKYLMHHVSYYDQFFEFLILNGPFWVIDDWTQSTLAEDEVH